MGVAHRGGSSTCCARSGTGESYLWRESLAVTLVHVGWNAAKNLCWPQHAAPLQKHVAVAKLSALQRSKTATTTRWDKVAKMETKRRCVSPGILHAVI
jgi:hypothetical protein